MTSERTDYKRMFTLVRGLPPPRDLFTDLGYQIVRNEQDCSTYFDLASKIWVDTFTIKEFVKPKNTNYYKEVRTAGNLLKSSYRMFSTTHFTPDNFFNFLGMLGDYNDTPDQISKENLIQLANNIETPKPTICTIDSFKEYITTKKNSAIDLLNLECLSAEQVHVIRRGIMRDALHLTQLGTLASELQNDILLNNCLYIRRIYDLLDVTRKLMAGGENISSNCDPLIESKNVLLNFRV